MNVKYNIEKKFLILGIGLTVVGMGCFLIDYNFLAIFYGLPGMVFFTYYFGYKIIIDDYFIIESYFWVKKNKLEWKDIRSVSKNRFNFIVLATKNASIRIPNVLPDSSKFIDDVIKRVDKNCVSPDLINEWSKTFTKYNDDFKGFTLNNRK